MRKNSDRKSRPKVVLVNRAIVLNENREILLLKRTESDSWMPGKWELPGGKLDPGQDISNALEREVLEETGLVVIPTDKTAYWHSEIISSGKYKGLPYIVLVGVVKSLGGKVKLSEEHEEFCWTDENDVFDYDLVLETRSALTVLRAKI